MNSAENRITELEKRISELEEKLENMMIYSDGANVSFKFSVTGQILRLKMCRLTVWKFQATETM